MNRITRYILLQCLGITIFITAALSAAVWVAQSLRLIDLIVNRGLSLGLFLYMALLILPRFLDIVLPIGVFIAVLFVFNRLTTESELVVMRAAGLSPLALAKPALILAGIACGVLASLSLYFLPVSNSAFKELLFEIQNRFVSALIQQGTFTTVSDKLTIYVRSRTSNGEVKGILISDTRNPDRPVTILAERGAFVDTPQGERVILVNGDRQRYDEQSRKLSDMTFARYTLDLNPLRDMPGVRVREAPELFMSELLSPPPNIDPELRRNYRLEATQRILIPLSSFTFCLIPLVCLFPGQLSRRGQTKRVLLAVAIAFTFESLEIGLGNLALRYGMAIPLMYLTVILPLAISFAILLRDRVGFGFPRLSFAASH